MPPKPRLCIVLSLTLLLPVLAHAEADPNSQANASLFDTEHIFGFAEGSDIGAKGELELESTTIGSFGALRSYSDIDNETSLRYNVANELRLSLGTLKDYFYIQDVPLLSDRKTLEFGIIAEARWHILDWRTAPFGMSLSLNPLWRLTDPTSGQGSSNFAALVTLLIDKEVIPEKFFAVLNLVYRPSFLQPNGRFDHEDSFAIVAGGSYALSPSLLIGAEIRHEDVVRNGSLNGHALFAGPQLYVRLSGDLSVKIAWALQVPDFAAHGVDLTSYIPSRNGSRTPPNSNCSKQSADLTSLAL
jgi:hypothetical protein